MGEEGKTHNLGRHDLDELGVLQKLFLDDALVVGVLVLELSHLESCEHRPATYTHPALYDQSQERWRERREKEREGVGGRGNARDKVTQHTLFLLCINLNFLPFGAHAALPAKPADARLDFLLPHQTPDLHKEQHMPKSLTLSAEG